MDTSDDPGQTPAAWDAQAATFDEEPDHGLGEVATRDAWRRLLLGVLPDEAYRIADLGCGTGTLSVLLAEVGHEVHGVDFSSEMIARAQQKARSLGGPVEFTVGDASRPPLDPSSYDVVLSRHVLWAMPDPEAAVAAWTDLLVDDGMLVLVEGNWSTGAGLPAAECERLVRTVRDDVEVTPLPEEVYWGKPITDERYLLVSRA